RQGRWQRRPFRSAKHGLRPRNRQRSLGKRRQSQQGTRPRISAPIVLGRFVERLKCYQSRRVHRQLRTTKPRLVRQRVDCSNLLQPSDFAVKLNPFWSLRLKCPDGTIGTLVEIVRMPNRRDKAAASAHLAGCEDTYFLASAKSARDGCSGHA